ncbi:hypothetical protein PRZ48_008534 [Zasmidium cellare]|uniref:Uncharacterized protein n=1 Tax=Zasmidium cellare TaxID=395010 RepID=A0ABR0EFS3_ZASCE|nr:hypothetical protein PRZ48_008534 [Zasmidium cellare]
MPLSLHETTVKTFIRQLKNLSACMRKAEQWCDDTGKSHTELLEARLAPDMYPLHYQIRAATINARNGVLLNNGQWSWVSTKAHASDERDFAGLQARIQWTVEWLGTVREEDIEGGEEVSFDVWIDGTVGQGRGVRVPTGQTLLMQTVFPQFWFHEAMAYAICRMKGVSLGKHDFMAGGSPMDHSPIEAQA